MYVSPMIWSHIIARRSTRQASIFSCWSPRTTGIVCSKDDIQRRYTAISELKQKPVILGAYVCTETDDGINRLIESVDFDKHTDY